MFLPLLGLTILLALDMAKGDLSESALKLFTTLVMILGGSLIILFGAFLLLMNKEVRRLMVSKSKKIKVSNVSSRSNILCSIAIHFTALRREDR